MNRIAGSICVLGMAVASAALGEEPAVYLEYLQGNGAQWIDTGYTPTKDARIVADIMFTEAFVTYQNEFIFCARTSEKSKTFTAFYYFYNSNNQWWRFDYANTTHNGPRLALGNRLLVEASKSGLVVNDATAISISDDTDFTPGGSLALFVQYDTNAKGEKTNLKYYGRHRLYSLQVYDQVDGEEKLVLDLKPAIDKVGAGGKEGLYDAVSGEFFTNKGTGFFRLGPEIGTGKSYHPASVTSKGNGTVEFTTGIYAHGSTYELTAVPAEGYQFHLWNGTTDYIDDNMRSANVTLTLNDTVDLTCDFKRSGSAQRVYVAPTAAGAKDGSSWENAMNDVAKACAKVAEYAAGGEVWLKTGAYLVKDSSVPLSDNIFVLGGFAGTETSAEEADEEANPVLLYGQKFTTVTWLTDGGASTGVKLADTTTTPYSVNLPPVEQFPEAHAFYIDSREVDRSIFYVGNELSATNCHFRGLTVAATGDYTIGSNSRLADGMTVERCTFIGCRPFVNNSGGTLAFLKTAVTVEDCEFIGCCQALELSGARSVTNAVRGCLFRHCMRVNGNDSSSLAIREGVSATVEDCSFLDNKCANVQSAAIQFTTTSGSKLLLSNCVFSNNWISANVNGSTVKLDGGSTEIVGCRFVGNVNVMPGRVDGYQQPCCIGNYNGGTVFVRDTYFGYNSQSCFGYTSGGSSGYPMAVIIAGSSGYKVVFVNCTIEGNVSETDWAGSNGGLLFGCWRSVEVSLINTVLLNNRCIRAGEWRPNVPTASGDMLSAVVNSVVWSDDPSFRSIEDTALNNAIANSVLKNCTITPETKPSGSGFFLAPISTDDPVLADATVTDPKTGRTCRSLDLEDSPFRRSGRPVWKGTNGAYYIYTSGKTPWRRISGGTAALDDASAAALGVTLAAAPIEDVVGKARSKRHCALGPLDLPVPGLMLLVK